MRKESPVDSATLLCSNLQNFVSKTKVCQNFHCEILLAFFPVRSTCGREMHENEREKTKLFSLLPIFIIPHFIKQHPRIPAEQRASVEMQKPRLLKVFRSSTFRQLISLAFLHCFGKEDLGLWKERVKAGRGRKEHAIFASSDKWHCGKKERKKRERR